MKDLGALMKQAAAMQQKMQLAQAKLAETVVEGSAGGGAVKVTLKGAGELTAIAIDDSLLQPGEGDLLSEMIVLAHADAKARLDMVQADLMKDVAGPLAGMGGGLPGLKF
jgi:DNA-binding YbaB/EbfC family protein